MPYLHPADQKHLADIITQLVMTDLAKAGELNYLFTKIAIRYLHCKGESYQTYNDIIGALEGAKLELYRRSVAPYENGKIKENGDVY